MAEVRIVAESRTEFGKGAARRVRRDHKVPAVLYGHGNDPRHITLPGHDLMLALKVKNALLTLEIAGADELAIPKDIQRDPIRGTIEHVDLLVVRRGEKVKVNVALHVIGQAVPDSLVVSELNAVEVECEATHIPTGFEVDITGRAIGTQILAKDIALPAGTELVTDPEALVVNITGAQTEAEAEAEMAEAEAEAGIVHEAPDAAAPAEALPGAE
ncbi:50S ribosomal protein L25/general stress protein Ctc [Sporichthya sp.]|uniref:50S ribosomal protein L25/general stress protein Ctc n=1 Tax=Sporichthya sp. TaxID=65475 RepID=UPI00181EFAF6|nr:50S ribosomal protein L25/general stress protein Ctc [Sporichthya sp.]MBA3745528.1 50S ribosomal protein L25/general stress protein Ctc [Sporichthya sp.]